MPFDGLPKELLSDLVKLRVALDGVKRGWDTHRFGAPGTEQHCAVGWLLEATGWDTAETTRLAVRYLYPVLPDSAKGDRRLRSVWEYNDNRNHTRIIKLFDDAVKLAEQQARRD
jgi:hypothetical protein